MTCGTVAAGGIVNSIRVLLGVRDQIFNSLDAGFLGEFRCNDQYVRCLSDQRNRSEVLDWIVGQFAEKVGVHSVRC